MLVVVKDKKFVVSGLNVLSLKIISAGLMALLIILSGFMVGCNSQMDYTSTVDNSTPPPITFGSKPTPFNYASPSPNPQPLGNLKTPAPMPGMCCVASQNIAGSCHAPENNPTCNYANGGGTGYPAVLSVSLGESVSCYWIGPSLNDGWTLSSRSSSTTQSTTTAITTQYTWCNLDVGSYSVTYGSSIAYVYVISSPSPLGLA